MTIRNIGIFSLELRLEAAQLIPDQHYTVTAEMAMNVGKSTMDFSEGY